MWTMVSYVEGFGCDEPSDQVEKSVVLAETKIDILVNNAGINRPAAGLEINKSEWIDHFDTNVKGGLSRSSESGSGNDCSKLGQSHLDLQSIWFGWNPGTARVLLDQGCRDPVGSHAGRGMGQTRHHSELGSTHVRRGKPDAR